ncbi:hypothetical protein OAS39_03680 [Pirellulales bacterium]|nr:hypothetical protein [Pirellulales bacterium]
MASTIQRIVVSTALLLGGILWDGLPAVAQSLPDFGVMYNNDGDMSYPSMNTATATQILNDQVGTLAGTPVKTFMYSIGSGSDILHYPTTVANNFGWRTTSLDNTPEWTDRVNNGKHYAQVGFDPFRVVGEKAKSMGMYFIPSYRMNDDHFVVDPLDYPLTGEFWINNQDKTIGTSPVAGYDYSNLLAYSHQEVRDYRLAVINESIDRYSDIMDGYELDFNRFQIFFAPGTAQTNANLMTDVVQQVRQRLDDVETQTGRSQYLFVRVPPALDNNDWSGLEVENWMQNGLVDVVIPSVLQTLSHDVPIEEFLTTAQTNGVQVVPSIYPRTNFGWDFMPNPDATTYSGPDNSRVAQAALTRGAISAYRYLGADGFQMYNHSIPLTSDWEEAAAAMDSANPSPGQDRIFAVTPGFFNDDEDTYEYAKQLPFSVPATSSQQFTMTVGDDIGAMIAENPRAVQLRLGLTNTTAAKPVTISINGQQLHSGPMTNGYFSLNAPVTQDGPQAYFHVTVDDLLMLQQGANTITVANDSGPNVVRITDIQLGVFGAPADTGIVNPADSSTFAFKYEGDPVTVAGSTVSGFGNTGYSGSTTGYQLTSDGNTLTVTDAGAPGTIVYLQSPNWAANATDAAGWTWEGRLKMNTGRFTMRIGDETDAHEILDIVDDGTVVSRIDGLLTTLPSTTDAMHTYRIAQAPGSDQYNVWIDDVLIALYDAGDTGIGTGGPHWWSDGSGSTNGEYELDYFRFTAGGFSPLVTEQPLADFNVDGSIDGTDFLTWQRGFGASGAPGTMLGQGDADGNGTVDGLDLDVWQSQFSAPGALAAATTVPEPSGLALVGAGLVWGLLGVWRRVNELRNWRSSGQLTAALAALVIASIGCAKGDGLDRVLVSGQVMYDGQPVETGQIRFRGIEGTRGPITIDPIEDGRYTTANTAGVPVGKHRVEITAYDPKEYAAKANRGPGVAPPKQLLPKKYNRESELTVELQSGSGQITKDFKLSK